MRDSLLGSQLHCREGLFGFGLILRAIVASLQCSAPLCAACDSPSAHPFGAPSLRCGVLRRFAPGRTKGSNQILT